MFFLGLVIFYVFCRFSLVRVVLYTVFVIFSLPQILVKTLAKNLIKHLAKHLIKHLVKILRGNLIICSKFNTRFFVWFLTFCILDITRPHRGDERSHRQEIELLDAPHLPITLSDLNSRQGTKILGKHLFREPKQFN